MTYQAGETLATHPAGHRLVAYAQDGDIWSAVYHARGLVVKHGDQWGWKDFSGTPARTIYLTKRDLAEIQDVAPDGDMPPLLPSQDGLVVFNGNGHTNLCLTPASQIQPRPVKWLWAERIPLGALTLLGGREGIGKSTYAYDLAADITRGTVPGEHEGSPKSVVVAATEDSWEYTIVPRLMAAGANLDRVFRVDTTDQAKILSLPDDLPGLAQLIGQHDVSLVLLDPLLSRLNRKLDTHKDAEVRQALEPLTRFADTLRIAVLGLIHVNKSVASDPLTMLMGSRAFAAVARAVLFVVTHPDMPHVRVLGQAKNNLGRVDLPSMLYKIEDRLVAKTDDGDIHVGKLVWIRQGEDEYKPIDFETAVEISVQSRDDRSAIKDASDWLNDYLSTKGGAEASATIKAEARKEGISDRTLQRARQKLGIIDERIGMPGKTYWKHPLAIIKPLTVVPTPGD